MTRAQGEVMVHSTAGLLWKDPLDDQWYRAVYHKDVRAELLEEAEREPLQHGGYKQPRAAGAGELDKTSFLLAQQTWGEQRSDRPDVLFVFEKPAQPHRLVAEEWTRGNRLVLDSWTNKPMLDYPEIPSTLSSELEGWHLEAICRSNLAIKNDDVLSRMPPIVNKKTKLEQVMNYSTLNMRKKRFRARTACLAWDIRPGSDKVNDLVRALVPAEHKAANSTKGFRDLTADEERLLWPTDKGKKSHDDTQPVFKWGYVDPHDTDVGEDEQDEGSLTSDRGAFHNGFDFEDRAEAVRCDATRRKAIIDEFDEFGDDRALTAMKQALGMKKPNQPARKKVKTAVSTPEENNGVMGSASNHLNEYASYSGDTHGSEPYYTRRSTTQQYPTPPPPPPVPYDVRHMTRPKPDC